MPDITHHKYTKEPRHPSGLIPLDFDFGKVIEQAIGDSPDSSTWIRYYEQGMKDFLRCTWNVYGRKITVVKASPMNAFSEYLDLLVSEGALERDTSGQIFCPCPPEGGTQGREKVRQVFDPTQLNQFPLPYVTFHDKEHRIRPGSNTNFPVRNMRFADTLHSKTNEAMRGVTYMRYPKPMTVPFEVNLWAKHEAHMKWMISVIEARFWDHMAYHRIEHPHPTPRKAGELMIMPIKLLAMTNNTELQRGPEADKIQRWTISVEVEAWAFYDELLAPTVQIADRQYLEQDGTELESTSQRLTELAPVPLDQQDLPSDPPSGDH